ncbi:MAG: dihydrodipicolinate synthase family protein [Verrucomicrobiota bacterium]|nr:dihydrodipicolinate synthase family protein [Limisphaera sp.]MDW8382108.1 dihydrodipicolinate synthase family protein [Verrucomicrobiota bacterium]
MKTHAKWQGVVVPMVTPVTRQGSLDVTGVERLVRFLISHDVDGLFVLGTTGEGASVPPSEAERLVRLTVAHAGGRVPVYAGLGELWDPQPGVGNAYLEAGAAILVARPPKGLSASELPRWTERLLNAVEGPLMLYNIPAIHGMNFPVELLQEWLTHPRLVGLKESENDPQRLEHLLERLGRRPNFSVFVGVGALMASGLRWGADGIVPSVANLIPDVCVAMWRAAQQRRWEEVDRHARRALEVAALYQNGRTLGESLAALKAALSVRRLCDHWVLPPLLPMSPGEMEGVRSTMQMLQLLG